MPFLVGRINIVKMTILPKAIGLNIRNKARSQREERGGQIIRPPALGREHVRRGGYLSLIASFSKDSGCPQNILNLPLLDHYGFITLGFI